MELYTSVCRLAVGIHGIIFYHSFPDQSNIYLDLTRCDDCDCIRPLYCFFSILPKAEKTMKNDEKINAWIKTQLETHKEPSFHQFMAKLLPGIDNILGIRLPTLRKIAKQLAKGKWQDYLLLALDDSYEEIMLQGLVLGYAQGNLMRAALKSR